MYIVTADQTTFAFRPDVPPVLRVQPGEIVRFETSEAPAERLLAAGSTWVDAIDTRAINAVSGPVYIENVMPGDAVSVEILAIEPLDWAWNAAIPGFGDYLVSSGILTRERLRAAQAYQRSMKVQLTTAIVTLGLATPQRIEWACVAHQSEVGQKRQQG